MRAKLRTTVIQVTIFVAVCALGIFAIFAIFSELRFNDQDEYGADFTNVSGLREGNFVRIGGVEVGKVTNIAMNSNLTVDVRFATDRSVALTHGTRAVIRWDNVIGDRYLELQEGAGGVDRLQPGQTIPVGQTEPALDLDSLVGGFRPLFRALDPEQVNKLTGQLISAFQGQGDALNSFLSGTASFTATLADRDELIGQVITNLNTLLGSLSGQSKQFATAIDSLSELVDGLAARKQDIANGIAHINAGSATVADLLSQARAPLQRTVTEGDRAASIVVADHVYVEQLIESLPTKYQALARQGIYGDYFSFYLCDISLKVNGKGGQPVYVKLVGQDSGRCTPK